MRTLRRLTAGLLPLAALLVHALPAVASEGGVEMIPFLSSNFLWSVINFAILVFLLVKFGKKPFSEGLSKRQRGIEQALRDAQEAKEMGAKNLADAERRLREKDAEVSAILEEAREIAVRENEKMLIQGREMSVQIVSQTKENLDQELKKARQLLRAETVALAMELAEQRIRAAVDPSAQERLVKDAIEKMEGMN